MDCKICGQPEKYCEICLILKIDGKQVDETAKVGSFCSHAAWEVFKEIRKELREKVIE